VPIQCPVSVKAFVACVAIVFIVGFGIGARSFPIDGVLGYLRPLESGHPIRMALRSQMFVECQLTLQGHLADITMEATLGFGFGFGSSRSLVDSVSVLCSPGISGDPAP